MDFSQPIYRKSIDFLLKPIGYFPGTLSSGEFFVGGYDGGISANGLDSDKNSATGSPLGIIRKLQASPKTLGLEQISDPATKSLLECFALQDIACSILTEKVERTNKKTGETRLTFFHPVNHCLKQRIDATKPVSVRYNPNRKKAHYDNLQRCGSIWTCTFCARKISEGRRVEVKTAMDNYRKKGGFVYLVTYTNRHHFGDDLGGLLESQKDAMVELWQENRVKKMLKNLGYEWRITACEVTYGKNGWHPHYHVLMFFDHEINTQGLETFLADEWRKACKKAGMQKLPNLDNGVTVEKGDKADAYVAKWGLEHEMTKGHTKKGKEGGLTPFDLLRQSEENPHYRGLFKQFADVFKGKHQLYWSKGMKAELGIANRSDEELATETDKESIEIMEVATQIWRLVLRYKIRGQYLKAVELDYLEGGGSRVYDLIMHYAEIEQARLNALERLTD